MTAYEHSLKDDELVSRSFIMKRLKIPAGEFKKALLVGPVRFPKPIITMPHPRWSLKQVDKWMELRSRTPEKVEGKYEVVLYKERQPTYPQIFNFARALVAIPELMAYFTARCGDASDASGIVDDKDWVAYFTTNGVDGLLYFDTIPRHHPKFIQMIKSLAPEDRCGYVVESVPYTSYSIFRDDMSDSESILDQSGHYDVTVIPKPGERIEVHSPVVPTSLLSEITARYAQHTDNHQLQLLLADINNLIFQE